MRTRNLVVGGGGITGAYSAGVLATLCRELGHNYFNRVTSCSVGVFASTFFVANQPDIIEEVWRNQVHGQQLINFKNPLRGKQILDLDYLTRLFRTGNTKLNTKDVLSSNTVIEYVITEVNSGRGERRTPLSEEEVFELMKASCSLPLVTSPVSLGGNCYVDGSLSNPLPLWPELYNRDDEIVVVYNKPQNHTERSLKGFGRLTRWVTSREVGRLVDDFSKKAKGVEEKLRDRRMKVIRPKRDLELRSIFDTGYERINGTFNQGIQDARDYLRIGII